LQKKLKSKHHERGSAVIDISDNGPGIPKKIKKSSSRFLFKDTARAGLGLSISKNFEGTRRRYNRNRNG
jgi:nitrogen-specific signal transduction histidine kinase